MGKVSNSTLKRLMAWFVVGGVVGIAIFLVWGRERRQPVEASPPEVPPRLAPELAPAGPVLQARAGPDEETSAGEQGTGRLRVRVLNEKAEGIAGATIAPDVEGDAPFRVSPPQSAWTTNQVGEAWLEGVDHEGAEGQLIVFARGYVSGTVSLTAAMEVAREDDALTVILKRGHSLSGVVTDRWGAALPKARIEALGCFGEDLALLRDAHRSARTACDLQVAETDSLGRFTISGIVDFPIRVRAKKTHYVDFLNGRSRTVEHADDLNIVMQPLLRAGIRPLDAESGAPLDVVPEVVTVDAPGLVPASYPEFTRPATLPRTGWNGDRHEHWLTFRPSGPVKNRKDIRSGVRVAVKAIGYEVSERTVPLWTPGASDAPAATDVRLRRQSLEVGTIAIRISLPKALDLALPWAAIQLDQVSHDEKTTIRSDRVICSFDEEGVARVRVPAGRYHLRIAPGSGWIWWQAAPDEFRRLDVPANEETAVVLPMRAAFVSAHIQFESGHAAGSFDLQVIGRFVGKEKGRLLGVLAAEHLREGEALSPYRKFLDLRNSSSGIEMLLPPGSYLLVAMKPAFGMRPAELTVENGDRIEVKCLLPDERASK